MTVFYYDKEKAEQGILFCLGQEDKVLTQEEIKEQGKSELYENVVTYTGNTVLIGHPIVEGDTVRKATEKELIDLGIKGLEEGEILEGDNIKTVDRPQPYPEAYEWQNTAWVLNQDLLPDGVYHDGNKFVEVPIPDNYIKYHWERPNWIDDTQDIDRVEKQYAEYLILNNPLDWSKMEEQGVLEDYKTFMKENEAYLERDSKEIITLSNIPQPSEKLTSFFSKIKKHNSISMDRMITKSVILNGGGEQKLIFNPLNKKIQNRASVITMSNLNTRIATLEGKAATTPITMKGLADRLAQVEATAKDWAVVTLTGTQTSRWAIPTQYLNGYNFYVVGWSGLKMGSYYEQEYSNNRINHYVTNEGRYRFIYKFERNGNYILSVKEQSSNPVINNITVMFYK